jgi:hypothetical protein
LPPKRSLSLVSAKDMATAWPAAACAMGPPPFSEMPLDKGARSVEPEDSVYTRRSLPLPWRMGTASQRIAVVADAWRRLPGWRSFCMGTALEPEKARAPRSVEEMAVVPKRVTGLPCAKPLAERARPRVDWPFWVTAWERPAGYMVSPEVTTVAEGCFWKIPIALACDQASA